MSESLDQLSQSQNIPSEKGKSPPPEYIPPPKRGLDRTMKELPPGLRDVGATLRSMGFPLASEAKVLNHLSATLDTVMTSGVDPRAKERFIRNILERFESLSNLKKENIYIWAKGLYAMSGETLPSDPDKDMTYYYDKFASIHLDSLDDIASGLLRAYSPQVEAGKNKYTSLHLETLKDGVVALDKNLSLTILKDFIDPYIRGQIQARGSNGNMYSGDIARDPLESLLAEKILSQIEGKIGPLKSRQTLLNFVKSGTLSPATFPEGSQDASIARVLLAYFSQVKRFQSQESAVRSIRNTSEGKKDFLIPRSDMVSSHPFVGEKNAPRDFGEIMLTLVEASQVIPYIGSALGSVMDVQAFYAGIDFRGGKTNPMTTSLSLIGGTIDVVSAGFLGLGKIAKAEKIAQAIARLSRALENLPSAIEKAIDSKILDVTKIASLVDSLTKIAPKLEQMGIPITKIISRVRVLLSSKTRTTIEAGRARDIGPAESLARDINALAQSRRITNDEARILKIVTDFPDLRNISEDLKKRIIAIHAINTGNETLGKVGVKSLGMKQRAMNELLIGSLGMSEKKAEKLTKKLIKGGYLGDMSDALAIADSRIDIVLKNKKLGDGVEAVLGKLEGETANQALIDYILVENPKISFSELQSKLEGFDIVIPNGGLKTLFDNATSAKTFHNLNDWVKNPRSIRAEELIKVILPGGKYQASSALLPFLENGKPEEVTKFLSSQVFSRNDGKSFLHVYEGKDALVAILERASKEPGGVGVQKIFTELAKGIPSDIPLEVLKILQNSLANIKKGISEGSITQGSIFQKNINKTMAEVDIRVDPNSPMKKLKAYLQGVSIDRDLSKAQFEIPGSPEQRVWNRYLFSLIGGDQINIDEFFEIIKRGNNKFFTPDSILLIEKFMGSGFQKLEKIRQDELRKWFDRGGQYESWITKGGSSIGRVLFPARYEK